MGPCVRAIRGAISVEANEKEAILQASGELLSAIVRHNDLVPEQVIAILFTATSDLDAAYPAEAVRAMGWRQVAMLCLQEMAVAGALPRCIRVLVLVNGDGSDRPVRHVYLREARRLRPDWSTEGGG
ncbi:MAG: chorismate mutase [Chloroflexia bacterium]